MTNGRRGGSVKSFGAGRIALWHGGIVWIGHAGEETGFHSHHAIQVTLSLSGGALYFKIPGEDWQAHAAAVIAAHQPHAFDGRGGLVALILIEPESREGRALRQRYPAGVASLAPDALAVAAAELSAAWAAGTGNEELAARARAVTTMLTSMQAMPPGPLDRRIARAIEVLRQRIGETVTLSEVADAVHLSSERFRHLFLQETGIRFRPYVLWLRIEVALAAYAAGKSLTEAAYAGGFADSAHFSRTFKRMFGVPAVSVGRI
ncbi:MAG TPA: AraC family transcriptional regulator [Noviherbaspirillum sp.]|uniref:helix-turn-helix transcriptional regulator n=1 Tax=Noviherbaspirillum sp. TaxID=1926288 RepID=UPI002D4CE8A1|nr:AraC family transcriptional regulator [Noviherbaspirillum sp.]HYD97272.1 AraC family transcriptional regulator [Noviherbaspirillum sp.]